MSYMALTSSETTRFTIFGLAWTAILCLSCTTASVDVEEIAPMPTRDVMPMDMPGMQHDMVGQDLTGWRMPPMQGMDMSMMPFLEGEIPTVEPFLPGRDLDEMQRGMLPDAVPHEMIKLTDGDVLDLTAGLVRREIGGQSVIMYGFNNQYPGPLLKVEQHSTITINFTNNIEFPTTLRWHGVRLENRFDGVPGLTQRPVRVGETFQYEVRFPDPGVFWYHPHQRGEIAQDLGLYGNILVESSNPDYYDPVNHEETLILDDILIDELGLVPWGLEAPTHALMGRFGNVILINGKTSRNLEVKRGDVVRYQLTNASNTRILNLSWGSAPIKLIAGDLGKFERDIWVGSVLIAPGQRYVAEVKFEVEGEFPLTSRIQAIDHARGEFYAHIDTLGTVFVADETTAVDHSETFRFLREHLEAQADIDRIRPYFDQTPSRELVLTLRVKGLLIPIRQMMAIDTLYVPPLEWNETMPMMNWLATGREVTWILPDAAVTEEGQELRPAMGWRFTEGDVVKIRLFNDPKSLHPMNHPMHLHGQRFLVLEQDGVRLNDFVWRDTVLVPVGSTVDILVEMSNPGMWMFNCQIPEHVGSGMSMSFRVDPAP